MRLVSKRQIFASSADRSSGTTGNFVLNCGQQQYLGENYEYKVYLQSLDIRNDFYQISAALGNDVVRLSTDNGNTYTNYTIPDGAPDMPALVNFLKTTCGLASAAYNSGSGKLTFSEATDVLFDNTNANPASAYAAIGMPQGQVTRIAAAVAPAFSSTPNLVSMRKITVMDVMCPTISEDRFQTQAMGDLQQSQRVARVPITAAFMQRIIYDDLDGANGTFISAAKDTLDQFQLSLQDITGIPLAPAIEWSFVLAIEVWSDTDRNIQKLLADLVTASTVTNRLLQLLVVGGAESVPDEQDIVQDMEYEEIPGLVPYGYPLPMDLHAGVRAPFNLGI